MGVKEILKKRSGLRVDNNKTTSAATLTLRQSLWPLSLVTILFFLWVCIGAITPPSSIPTFPNPISVENNSSIVLGFRIRAPGYTEQAFSGE